MSQILLHRLSAHSNGFRAHGCRLLSSAVYGSGGGGRRRAGGGAAPPQDDESSRAVRVSVWWDFENCNIPNGVNVYRVAPRVSAALRAAGIRGPLSITAFGDVLQLSRSSQEALAATGVSISHVPSSGKNSSDRSFMADLVYWIAQNPPPVHFFLISGDRDFANILHRLRMSNYNVLLACPSSATSVLCSAATIMWPWDGLVRGEDLSPKRFNHPPDGLHGSWYGHYRGALDDPSLEKESVEPIKVASDPKNFSVSSGTKPSPVPKYVANAILDILLSYPEGLQISHLRQLLINNKIDLGTNFFGHMKFSCLLESMPDVKLVGPPNGENEPRAIRVNKRLLQLGDRALDGPFLEKESEEPINVPSQSQHCSVPSSTKPSSVPKYVTNAILEVLRSYPEGINLSQLRAELMKKKVSLGPDFFGHKKFSCLLQSIPDIVELVGLQTGEGYAAIAVNRRLLQPGDGCAKTLSSAQCNVRENSPTGTAHSNKKHTLSSQTQSIDRSRSFTEILSEHPPTFSVLPSPSNGLSEDQNDCPVADVSGSMESPAKHREVDEMTTPRTPSSSRVENAANEDGFFKRIWTIWNGPENVKSEVSQNCESTSAEGIDDLQTPLEECNGDRRIKFLRRIHNTTSKNDHSDGTESAAAVSDNLSISLGDDHSEKLKRDPSIPENPEPCSDISLSKSGKKDDISEMNGLFKWASRWWTFGKSDAEDSSTTNINAADEPKIDSIEEFESSNSPTYESAQQVVHEIFTKPDLWDVLEQQLSEPLGSEVVLKAKTREELAHGLRKLNCWPLKGLLEKDLHHLVHLLISEKKWIEETSSRFSPFHLTLPHKRKCVPSSSSKSSGLSFIFSRGKPQKDKYADDKSRKSKSLTREEILSDCHKLLKELLSESEYGFNIGIFKRRFTQKYGYELDHRKLGYPDLESLLQIMPDARVKFPRVMPSEHGNGQGGSKGNGNRSNGDDLIWEELGPVSATTEAAAAEGINKEMCYCPPTPSDDEFSDSDSVKDPQPRRNAEQQSSLLQIIGSWNSSKGDGSSKKLQDIDGLVDCSRGSPGNLDSMTSGKSQTSSKLLHKHYSFVSDSGDDSEPDKLVESVLGSLQKARGSKLHN